MAFEHKKESTKARESFFIEFAEKMKPMLKNAVLCTTGGFRVRIRVESTCLVVVEAKCPDPASLHLLCHQPSPRVLLLVSDA
jgi:hypothetical protein